MQAPPKTDRPDEFWTLKQANTLRDVSKDHPRDLKLFKRVYSADASPRESIKAHCLHCAGHDIVAIRSCTASGCPLWKYRPFQQGVAA